MGIDGEDILVDQRTGLSFLKAVESLLALRSTV